MKTYTLLFFLLIFAFSYNITAKKNEIKKNDPVSKETKGHVVSLDKFKGSVLVMYFFGNNVDNWDQPIAELNRLKEKFKNKKVRIGALTDKTQEEIEEYMKTMDFIMFAKSIDFAVVTDSDSAKKYKTKPPYAYIIAPDGQIYWKGKSLRDIGDKINEVLENPLNSQNKGTNVYAAKLTGEVTHFKDTTPKLNYDDSDGIDDPGVKEGTTFYKDDQPDKVTLATEADELNDDTKSQIANQRIEEYEGTPGLKETKGEYEARGYMSPDED